MRHVKVQPLYRKATVVLRVSVYLEFSFIWNFRLFLLYYHNFILSAKYTLKEQNLMSL